MTENGPDFARYEALIEENEEKFRAFEELLLFYNARFNLTAVTEHGEIRVKHFLDSLAGEHLFPEGARVAEVGSGAGFPSVPLLIARRDLAFTLVESTGKKCEFLRTAVKELDLNAEVVWARAEDLGRDAAFREKFGAVCARAVARLNVLAEYCLPLVLRGGVWIAYKGKCEEERKEAEHAVSVLGGREESVCRYALPGGAGERTLLAVRKVSATPHAYPRGRGAERKAPL